MICSKLDIKVDIRDCIFYDGCLLEDIVKFLNNVNLFLVILKERLFVVMLLLGIFFI